MDIRKFTLSIFLLCSVISEAQNVELNFDLANHGTEVSPNLMGIFFEEINHAGEGGLYAELLGNRSFEDKDGSTDWWSSHGNVEMKVVTDNMITKAQHHALSVNFNGSGYIENTGYWGIKVVKGETYRFSLWARTNETDHFNGGIHASLVDEQGSRLGGVHIMDAISKEWRKYTVTFTATESCDKASFRLWTASPSSLTLDIISLFPPTFKGHENGLRRDLAQMLADIKPRFVRFPGGCYVEGDYRGGLSDNRYRWKTTIGPIEERSGHLNQNWGYYVQDGLGFHEYLQLCEDLNAEALFVVNVGLGHNWLHDYRDLDEYVQEALDAVEYANGDTTTYWGRKRAQNGHPAPFKLKYIEIGNENYNFHMDSNRDQSEHYPERYYTFYKAFKEKYPEIVLVGNVESWGTDDPSWRNDYPVEMVDEHYYRSPSWFVNNYEKYDKYDRNGPKVYVGEYAVTQGFGVLGHLNAALGEAVFMQGMENNSDIVAMASYAPIFINENAPGWMPDMIRFNCHMAYGTPSYYVQKMFGNSQGKVNIKWTEKNNSPIVMKETARKELRKVGLGTWGTQSTYSNIKVTDKNGKQLLASLPSWSPLRGQWTNTGDGNITQASGEENAVNICSALLPDTVTYSLTAVKHSGREGFLIVFDYKDDRNFTWLNIGGWENTQHGLEQTVNGVRGSLATKGAPRIENGRVYNIRIEKCGVYVKCYLDDTLLFDVKLPNGLYDRAVYTSASVDESGKELIVKLTNPNATDSPTKLSFANGRVKSATVEVLTSENGTDENSTANPKNIVPETKTVKVRPDGTVDYTVPAYSFNILRLKLK